MVDNEKKEVVRKKKKSPSGRCGHDIRHMVEVEKDAD